MSKRVFGIKDIPTGREEVKQAIRIIGKELINLSDEICENLDDVQSIKIEADINAGEVVKFNITKKYVAVEEEGVDKDEIREVFAR